MQMQIEELDLSNSEISNQTLINFLKQLIDKE